MNFSDDDILEKITDPATVNYGFNLLMDKYQEQVYWVVRRMVISHEVADDVTQDVFVKVWKNIAKFKGDSKLFTWIYRIATNEALSQLRKQKRRFFMPLNNVEQDLEQLLVADAEISGEEIERKLQLAILKLPEKQRLVFNMKYFQELKFTEIADIMEVTVGALKAQYHHAVKKIEKSLKLD